MASESGATAPASSSSPNATDPYIGSFISLISKSEIRYEGVLCYLNVQDSTIGLNNVRSFGTEGRKKDGPQIPPVDKVYEYILFRGSDIKDLQVKSSPPVNAEQIHHDPAIIQSHYAGMRPKSATLASSGSRTLTDSAQLEDSTALTSRAYPSALPSSQSVTNVGHSDDILATQGPSSSTVANGQGQIATSVTISHDPQQSVPFQRPSIGSCPLTMPSRLQPPEIQATPNLLNTSEFGTPLSSSIASGSVHPNLPASFNPLSLDKPSSLSTKSSSPYPAPMTANGPNISLIPSSCIDIRANEAQFACKAVSDPRLFLHNKSMPYVASPFVDSLGPLLTPSPSLLASDGIKEFRPCLQASSQKLCPDKIDLSAPKISSFRSLSSISMPVSQAPLLPLPGSSQEYQHSSVQYTEEFDFIAMNEKFKKDEVWGYLGKTRDKPDGVQSHATSQGFGEREGRGLIPNPKPAYNKDEFFDSISCNSLHHGARNGQNRFSERVKLDTETFGNFQRRSYVGYGGYAAGRGNYRESYNSGRGYGYAGRGHSGNMPF